MTIRITFYDDCEHDEHGHISFEHPLGSDVFEDRVEREGEFLIEKHGTSYFITPLCKELFVGDDEVGERREIRNGSRITIGEKEFKFTVEFSRAPFSKRSRMLSYFGASLVLIALMLECFIVFWLPMRVKLGSELEIPKYIDSCALKIQMVRLNLKTIVIEGDGDELVARMVVKELLQNEVNRLAVYFKNNRDRLSLLKLKDLQGTMDQYNTVLAKLKKGRLWHDVKEPDIEGWLKKNCGTTN